MAKQRRARRTQAEWSALLSAMKTSGQSESAFARAYGLSTGSIAYWKSKLSTEDATLTVAPKARPAFSEIVVVPRARTPAPRIEVVMRSGASIRLEGGFDAALLREVLKVVESC